jgi:hypothetical protein
MAIQSRQVVAGSAFREARRGNGIVLAPGTCRLLVFAGLGRLVRGRVVVTRHPHVHMIVPGGGISRDGKRWVACRDGFFLPVRVLSRLFRRLFLDKLAAAHAAGQLKFFGNHAGLADAQAFAAYLAPLRQAE